MTTATNIHADIEALEAMTGKDLIAIFNAIADETGADKIGSWKKAKSLLIEAILAEQAHLPADDVAETQSAPEETETQSAPAEEEEAAPKRTIKSAALEHLGEIAYYEDRNAKYGDDNRVEPDHPNAQSVGIPYAEVIERIKYEFDGAETSVSCLRWYAVKVRGGDQGYEHATLPQRRPRAKVAKKEAAAE